MSIADSQYTGTDNLEVMAEAVNYNDFLANTVARRLHAGDRVLDFGAGIGTFAGMLKARRYDVTCVEPDPAQRATILADGMPCAESLSQVPDGEATFVFTLNVLEHIEDDGAALKEIYRVLRTRGRPLIYVPAFMCLYSAMDRKVGHVRRYRKRRLAHALRAAGFDVRRAGYVDSLGFFASLIYRYVGDSSGGVNRNALKLYDRFVFPVSRLLDRVCSPFFGKNLLVIAQRPGD